VPGFLEWLSDQIMDASAGRESEIESQQEREANLERRPETYFGTSTPVVDPSTGGELDPTTGRPFARTVGGTERRDDPGLGWSWLTTSWQRIVGETTTTKGRDESSGREVIATSEDRSTTRITPGGKASYEHVDGTRAEVLDVTAMASTARGSLAARRETRADTLAATTAELASIDARLPTATEEERAALERRRGEVSARKTRLDRELAAIDRDLAALEAPALDERGLAQITRANSLEVRPVYTTDWERRVTTSASVERKGVGLAGNATRDTREVRDGTTTTGRVAANGSVDAWSGNASVGISAQGTSSSGGVTETSRVSHDATLSASGGRITGGYSSSSSYSSADRDGNVSAGASSSSARSGSVIASGDELGVGYSKTDGVSATVDGVTASRSDTTSTSITDRGVRRETSTDRSISRSRTANGTTTGWRGGAKTSANGGFSVNVEPVPGSLPPQYRVTMALSAGAGLRLSGEASRTTTADAASDRTASAARGSASGGVNGSVQMTYCHLMSESEARAYMAEADAADAGSVASARPEFGLISRLSALAHEGDDAVIGGAAVLGSATAATMLDSGESIELTLTGSISGEASGSASYGAFGGGLEAGGSLATTRRVRVEPATDARGTSMIDVTVTFEDASTHRLGGSLTFEGVTAGGRVTGADSESRAATVRLDPSSPTYAEDYHAVCAALSIDDVRTLATRFTRGRSETEGQTVTAGALGVSMSVGSSSSYSEEVSTDLAEGQLTGSFSGGVTDSASISALGTAGVQASERNTARATVDAAGLDVTLETEKRSSDMGRSLSEGYDALGGWFGKDDHDASDIARAVATSPAERLRAQLELTYARLEEYSLSEPDIDVLVGRAGNLTLWNRCVGSHRILDAWETLRTQLRSPSPDAEWVEIDRANADKLARGRALAQFMASSGRAGMTAMTNCLRHWGEGAGWGDMSIGSADDLAVYREWPSSITNQRSKLLTARSRIRTADEHFVSLISRDDGLSRGEAWRDDTSQKLTEVRTAVAGCCDFAHPRAKMEMLDEVARLEVELGAAWSRNADALAIHIPVSLMPAPAPLASDPEALECLDASAPPTTDEIAARERLADLGGLLVGFKAEETRLFAHARSLMRVEHGGTIDGTWDYMWNGDEIGGINSMSEVAELHEAWIARIRELRSVYERLGTPPSQWMVSSGPGAPRNPRHEPDGETLYQIFTTSTGTLTSNISVTDRRTIGRQWRERVHNY
jgi:hypothetical protein